MVYVRNTDRIMLRPRPLFLKSKLKGQADIAIRNMDELTSFLATGRFQKSHLAALVHRLYCPQVNLNAIFSNVSRLIMKHISINTENFDSWTARVLKEHFPIVKKLTELYFLN